MKKENETIIIEPDDIILDEETEKKKNKFFEKFKKTDPKELKFDKIEKMNLGPVKKVWDHVLNLWNVVKNDKISLQQKAMAVGALVYLISPIDAIPDVVPVLGLTDDVAVITMVVTQLASVIKTLNTTNKDK